MLSVLDLTPGAEILARALYREYLARRAAGISKSEAFSIGGAEYIRAKLCPGMTLDSVDKACDELFRLGLIFKGLTGYAALTPEFLAFCEKSHIKV